MYKSVAPAYVGTNHRIPNLIHWETAIYHLRWASVVLCLTERALVHVIRRAVAQRTLQGKDAP
jgi:hypothetical protein